MTTRQRLAVFLDGTWNTRDDSTNVQHLHTLTREGLVEDGWLQRRYYHQGVGTGVMDNFTGGGFGFGLEGNVRAAYNWLVEHYNDGDEIYVFGFSRGAFTARSLVGFISTCGLIHRGAPLTVEQLWQGYCAIGKQREDRHDWWDELVGRKAPPFRRITRLKWDNGQPLSPPENETETLLVEHSRRVPITYLGVFDTVGALGLDALAIPGLRSRMAQHHNAYPTKLVEKCRHALALDENRSSFKLTPFLEFVPNHKRDATPEYDGCIEQRWFVGAHANIGGGYGDNTLTIRPLHWMAEGANQQGLHMHPLRPSAVTPRASQRRDSYSEFAAPIWSGVVRAKRHYRPIDRPIDARAHYALRTINEQVDESVAELAAADPSYAPPQLMTYAQRSNNESLKTALADRKADHEWSGRTLPLRAGLLTWSCLAVLGTASFAQLFSYHFPVWGIVVTSLIASAFLVIDRIECFTNLQMRNHPQSIGYEVGASVTQAFRLIIVLLMATGALTLIGAAVKAGWTAKEWTDGIWWVLEAFAQWGHLPIIAGVTMTLLDVPERRVRIRRTLGAAFLSLFGTLAVATAIVLAVMLFKHLLQWEHVNTMQALISPASEESAGRLLLLQIMLAAFYVAWHGSNSPLGKHGARLGTMTGLQLALTPGRVEKKLDSWAQLLKREWADDPQAEAIAYRNRVLRNALWRDIVAFIPVYAPIMALTMWLGMEYETPRWWADVAALSWQGVPLWIGLPLATALLDLIEDAITFRYLRGRPSAPLALFGALVTVLKLAAFAAAAAVCIMVYVNLTEHVVSANLGDWRWVLASLSTIVIALFAATRIAIVLSGLLRTWRRRGEDQSEVVLANA